MIVSDKIQIGSNKRKTACDIKCDRCGNIWQGNYYINIKKDNLSKGHQCPITKKGLFLEVFDSIGGNHGVAN